MAATSSGKIWDETLIASEICLGSIVILPLAILPHGVAWTGRAGKARSRLSRSQAIFFLEKYQSVYS
jgi:hypothetical protein